MNFYSVTSLPDSDGHFQFVCLSFQGYQLSRLWPDLDSCGGIRVVYKLFGDSKPDDITLIRMSIFEKKMTFDFVTVGISDLLNFVVDLAEAATGLFICQGVCASSRLRMVPLKDVARKEAEQAKQNDPLMFRR